MIQLKTTNWIINPLLKRRLWEKRWPVFFSYFRCLSTCVCTGWGWQGLPTLSFGCRPTSKHTKSHDNTARKTIRFILERQFQLDDGDDHHVWRKLGQDVLWPNTEYLRCKAARHRYIALFKHPENWTTIVSGNKAVFYSALFQIFFEPTICIFQTYELEH